MRYRAMTADGDYNFGGNSTFLINTPGAVAQAVLTRLRLLKGEWFLDQRVGLDMQLILGYNTASTRDQEVQRCILETEGVQALESYESSVINRDYRVTARIDTIYGIADFNEVL